MPVSPPAALTPGDETAAPPDDETAALPDDRPATALVPTHACANCHHRFAGRYCSHCGQKADAELTVLDIVGSFLRELVDLDRGLWPTLKGLTRRPGRMLRHYLGGARKQYMNSGRYLLLSVIVTTLVEQALVWTGVEAPSVPATQMAGDEAAGPIETGMRALLVRLNPDSGPEGPIAVTLLMVASLSLLYRRLFPARLTCYAEALALTAFATAHALLLSALLDLAYKIPTHLVTGKPVDSGPWTGLTVLAVYLGVAVHGCLGRHVVDGVRAALMVPWAYVEVIISLVLVVGLYASALALLDPESRAATVAGMETGAVVTVVVVFAVLPGVVWLVRAGLLRLLRTTD